MLLLEIKQIKGIFSRTTGWSKWAIRPAEQIGNQSVIFPPHEGIKALANAHFGPHTYCEVHVFSGKGYWRNTIILDIPTGTTPDERQGFVNKLALLTQLSQT